MTDPSARPSSRSFTLLVNPAAGGGAAPGAVLPVARALRDAGARVDVTYSPGPLAMAALVAQAVGRGDVVVSVGGDGMLSSVAGLVSGAGGTLGVVPAGRGNDFARMLGLPLDADGSGEVARRLLEAPARDVDLIGVRQPDGGPDGERVVVGSVYAGVDARAAELVSRMHRVPGRLQYPLAAVRALATYRPASARVVVDGRVLDVRAATVVVANSAYYGQGMRIAPAAVLDDGLLDVVVIEATSRLQLVRSLPKVYDGAHVDLTVVTVLRGRRVEVSADAAEPVCVGADGERLGVLPGRGGAPLVVEVRPGALSVIA